MSDHPFQRFLIVGSGIAGSLLAWELLRLGRDVTICSDPANPGSSRIAAGLVTPVTGRRFVKSWNFDRVFPQAQATYLELEKLSGKTVFQPLDILRLFKNEEEVESWARKSASAEMQKFIIREWKSVPPLPGIVHQGGGLEIRGGGWIDIPALLETLHFLMKGKAHHLPGPLDYPDLQFSPSGMRWRDRDFDRVIFCQGYRPDNPWFDWLNWKPAQGEILTLRIPGLRLDRILNRGLFVLPLGNGLFRCGSTYSWDYLKSEPSPAGLAQLQSELGQLINLPFEVVEHSAAVRPILKDTLPVIGMHPRHQALGIFNGLGSKGTLTAPFYARHFARHLAAGHPLDPEVDAARNN